MWIDGWYQWILEKYQHFNTFDTGIVNELLVGNDSDDVFVILTSEFFNHLQIIRPVAFGHTTSDLKRQFLNHCSLLRLLVVFDWWKHINMDVTFPFWVIMRSGRRNVMNHIASRGTIFVVLSSRCGNFF
jgi:hypothetical protein